MELNKQPKKSFSKEAKVPAQRSVKCRLVEAVWTFWPAFQRWADSQTQEDRLTPQRTRILASLQSSGPQIMSSLKNELGVTATNITALIDAMEKDGLVLRKAHPTDRRATIIEITPKAKCELAGGCLEYRDRVSGLFSVLSESDRTELLRILETLKTHLDSEAT